MCAYLGAGLDLVLARLALLDLLGHSLGLGRRGYRTTHPRQTTTKRHVKALLAHAYWLLCMTTVTNLSVMQHETQHSTCNHGTYKPRPGLRLTLSVSLLAGHDSSCSKLLLPEYMIQHKQARRVRKIRDISRIRALLVLLASATLPEPQPPGCCTQTDYSGHHGTPRVRLRHTPGVEASKGAASPREGQSPTEPPIANLANPPHRG